MTLEVVALRLVFDSAVFLKTGPSRSWSGTAKTRARHDVTERTDNSIRDGRGVPSVRPAIFLLSIVRTDPVA